MNFCLKLNGNEQLTNILIPHPNSKETEKNQWFYDLTHMKKSRTEKRKTKERNKSSTDKILLATTEKKRIKKNKRNEILFYLDLFLIWRKRKRERVTEKRGKRLTEILKVVALSNGFDLMFDFQRPRNENVHTMKQKHTKKGIW